MAKRSSTVNLENTIWDKINSYAKLNGVNRNTAIEWIVLQHESLSTGVVTLPPAQIQSVTEPFDEVSDQPEINLDFGDVTGDAFDNMLD